MPHDPVTLWLAAGALIIAFEAFTAPGIGLFLFGLGAICASLVLKAGLVGEASTGAQFAWCFGATVVWTIVLWKPLRKFRLQHRHGGSMANNNVIGETATVAKGGLTPGHTGQVIWSGTLMNAELDSGQATDLAEGTKVQIRSISGNTLKVVPK